MAAYRFWNEKENRHWTKKDFEASFDGSGYMFDSCWDMMITKHMKNGDIKQWKMLNIVWMRLRQI